MFHILVVEDDKSAAALTKAMLTHAGYEVFQAGNGMEGLELLDVQHIDLIVLDIIMPKMDGYEFTERLRSCGSTIPILMVTARQLTEEKCKGFLAGADDYMVKPVNREEFLLRIKALLRRSQIASERKLHITPRKGDYCLLDKEAGGHVSHTIFQLPTAMGKGILVTPTVHGNLLTGPTAKDIEDKEGTATTAAELAEITAKAALSVKNIPFRQVITSFCGLRAHEDSDDFVIGEAADAPGFFDAAGIESPGLSSAPAIGAYLAEQIAAKTGASRKESWNGRRKGIVRAAELSFEERAALIKERPEYGTIICRCEGVSEGEIMDAINRTLGAVSLDGIKRRVRQGMGRCQAGFCTPRTMEILARERGMKMEDICKNSSGSNMLAGGNEEGR